MNVYNLKKIEKCFVCGNIDTNINTFIQEIVSKLPNYKKVEHPKEIERQERLKKKNSERGFNETYNELVSRRSLRRGDKLSKGHFSPYSFDNSVIIVSGNCGIGTKSMEYYQNIFEELNNALSNNNCYVFFVRGNNDDPSIFHNSKINFEHVKTIPDYSIISLKAYNCLCIGGSISLDKEWKLFQEETFGKKMYWSGEEPYLDEKELDEIIKKHSIGCIISSTSPSFSYPSTNALNNSKWVKNNSSIKKEVSSERNVLDKIYNKIVENDVKPYVWAYGKFKERHIDRINDIVFLSLASFQFMNVGEIITNHFGINVSKKLGENTFSLEGMDGISDLCEDEEKLEEDIEMDEPIARPRPIYNPQPFENAIRAINTTEVVQPLENAENHFELNYNELQAYLNNTTLVGTDNVVVDYEARI